jgi:hypothetical protein
MAALPGPGKTFSRVIEAHLMASVAATGLFVFFVLPSLDDRAPFNRLSSLSDSESIGAFGVAAIYTAFMATLMTPTLRRFLEGYSIPKRWRIRLEARQAAKRAKALATVERYSNGTATGPEFTRASVILHGFPGEQHLVLSTTFGNRIKAAETYGKTRFGLDTPTVLFDLRASVDATLVSDVDQAALVVDAAVGAMTVSVLFVAASVVAAVWSRSAVPLLGALGASIALVPLYYGAREAATEFLGAMRALVNVGRIPLATKLGLQLPASLADERRLWSAVHNYVFWGPGDPPFPKADGWVGEWDRHRAADTGAPPPDHA